MNPRKILIALSIIHQGNWNKIYYDLDHYQLPDMDMVEKICSNIKCRVVTICDADYPQYLKEIYKPPFVLFYYGDLSLIKDNSHNIAVVGSRNPGSFHLQKTRQLVNELAKELVVVSGLAKGIDREAHVATIESGGKTVAVLGTGLDMCYPSCNKDIYNKIKKEHLLISEYYGTFSPEIDQFAFRNRLIVAMSNSVFIPHGNLRSGTSVSANYALMSNKTIFCLPSDDVDNSLCDSIIRDGAILVRNSEDILYELQ